MKRILLLLALVPFLAGCAKKTPFAQEFVLDSPYTYTTRAKKTDGVDYDLSELSATMVYAEVFNMLVEPDLYENKSIRIKGDFAVYEEPDSGERFFAVIVSDATACCQEGVEFVWLGEHSYPEDYPEIGAEVTVTGTYVITTLENGLSYAHLEAVSVQI